MKKAIKILFVAIALCLSGMVYSAHAQMPIPIGPGDGDGHTTPIGGMAVLAALGGGYAVKKLKDRKQ